jgi:hypothetical protein
MSRAPLRELIACERAQASVEYMLLLSIGAAMAITVMRKLISPVLARLSAAFSAQLDSFFSRANLHSLKIGR